ncbi:MAG: FAD binding domain-containing protein [Phycisphaeraceae bacterium]|nr:FAD binding domain-containing protein [Phycisphaeraceae bacterium]
MNSFAIAQPKSFSDASEMLKDKKYSLAVVKAGGIDLIDLLKEGLIAPDVLIDVRRLHGTKELVAASESEVTIDATATLADIASSSAIREAAPVLAQAVEGAASPAVRNSATAAGNLLQRPRCWYFRNEQFNCLKKGGPTCFAIEGENRYHAIFGDGPCHIVHPSNLAPALLVCDATIHLSGAEQPSIPIRYLYHTPDKGVRSESNLSPGAVITHITCKPAKASGFYAIKEKQSFDWPVVAAAVALELNGTVITKAVVCAGAVAPIPWELRNVANALRGVDLADDAALTKACSGAAAGAKPMSENAYKMKLLPVAVKRAVLIAAGRKAEVES